MAINYNSKHFIINTGLLILMSCALFLVLGEAVIQTAIFTGVDSFCKPELYADYFSDDDYWKLHHKWVKKWPLPSKEWVDPFLGWAPPKTECNPLGVMADGSYTPDFNNKSILFYGDSFVSGAGPLKESIPQLLDPLLLDYNVHNYGVGGYGVDQIYLRFKNTYSLFQKPHIIFGILPRDDLDRCVLTFRIGQKPYFVIKDNKLVLKGVPINPNPEQWLSNNPPQTKSYLLAFIVRKLRILNAKGDWIEMPYRQIEKKQINARIIKEIVKETHSHNLPLLFVIFYCQDELTGKTGWREVFLKEELEHYGVPYIDTRQILVQAAQQESADTSKYYFPPGTYGEGHLNEQGNTIIAKALAEYFLRYYHEDITGSS